MEGGSQCLMKETMTSNTKLFYLGISPWSFFHLAAMSSSSYVLKVGDFLSDSSCCLFPLASCNYRNIIILMWSTMVISMTTDHDFPDKGRKLKRVKRILG